MFFRLFFVKIKGTCFLYLAGCQVVVMPNRNDVHGFDSGLVLCSYSCERLSIAEQPSSIKKTSNRTTSDSRIIGSFHSRV